MSPVSAVFHTVLVTVRIGLKTQLFACNKQLPKARLLKTITVKSLYKSCQIGFTSPNLVALLAKIT